MRNPLSLASRLITPSLLCRRRRKIYRVLPLVLLVVLGCSENTHEYGPTRDAEALRTIVGVWVGQVEGHEVTLTICEDRAAAAEKDSEESCSFDHLVGSQSRKHTEKARGGVGCGGCWFSVEAPIKARFGNPADVGGELEGVVVLGDGYEDDPYALPYALYMENASLVGTISSVGKLELQREDSSGSVNKKLPKTMLLSSTPADCSWVTNP